MPVARRAPAARPLGPRAARPGRGRDPRRGARADRDRRRRRLTLQTGTRWLSKASPGDPLLARRRRRRAAGTAPRRSSRRSRRRAPPRRRCRAPRRPRPRPTAEVEDQHQPAARRGDRRPPAVVARPRRCRRSCASAAAPPARPRRAPAGRPPAGAPRAAADARGRSPATAAPPPACRRARWRCAGSTGAAAPASSVERLHHLARGDVDIGEVRAHGREVELGPPRGRVGLDAAVRHRQPPPVRHQPHLVRPAAARGDLADPPVAVARRPRCRAARCPRRSRSRW